MYILSQNGLATYNADNAYAIRLEYTCKDAKKYGKYRDAAAVIVIYYKDNGKITGSILAQYKEESDGEFFYRDLLLAIADHIAVYDFNGMLQQEKKTIVDESEPERGV